jgi:GNAT superfamily N-acetyltransferase
MCARRAVVVRPVSPDERADWEPLWKGYQTFYQVALSDETTATTWARLHDPAEPMGLLGAHVDGRLIGIAHYIFHRSCWTVGDYCYLQDLFVAEDARGLGAGRALIEAVEKLAREAGASRLHWLTKEDNAAARSLYDKLADRSGFIQYRKLF